MKQLIMTITGRYGRQTTKDLTNISDLPALVQAVESAPVYGFHTDYDSIILSVIVDGETVHTSDNILYATDGTAYACQSDKEYRAETARDYSGDIAHTWQVWDRTKAE